MNLNLKKIIHLIVGTRPNIIKISPLFWEFQKFKDEFSVKIIHTGQHYDPKMSGIFFSELQLPNPNEYLGVGSGSQAYQIALIMEKYEKVIEKNPPHLVIVAGDVNSTLACTLSAIKQHIPVAHIEAGLRSFDKTMSEEINRIVTDSISQFLLTPSIDGNQNLLNEGVDKGKIFFVGNIMIDSLIKFSSQIDSSNILKKLKLEKYALLTLHRPSNVDSKIELEKILDALEEIHKKIKIVFPMHPRTKKQIIEFGFGNRIENIPNLIICEPLGYFDFSKLLKEADFVLTDSGGVQEESTFWGVQCLTLRPNTERPITISDGTNELINLDRETIIQALNSSKMKKRKIPEKWDGKTAERIVSVLRNNEIFFH